MDLRPVSALSGALDFLVRMLPGVLGGGGLFLLLRPLRRRRLAAAGLSSPRLREAALLCFFLFCGGLALLTLTPRWFHWTALLDSQSEFPPFFRLGDANLLPFRTFQPDPWSVMILLGNVVMFLPLGFFPALLYGLSWRGALAAGLCVTLSIECWQLLIGRTFDVDDLLLNTLGILLGHLLCLSLGPERAAPFRITPR